MVMVDGDGLIMQCERSKYIEDGDDFLLMLSTISIQRTSAMSDARCELSEGCKICLLSPILSRNYIEDNVLAYTGGYIATKVQRKVSRMDRHHYGRARKNCPRLMSIKQVAQSHDRLVLLTPHLLMLVEQIELY